VTLAASLGAIAIAAGLTPACNDSSTETVEHPCPPGQTCSVNLTLLHTSDIHSRLFPYEQVITQADAASGLGVLNSVSNIGGVARMAHVINRERARAGRTLHLDSGDCFQGAPIFNFFAGEPEVRALSALGLDAAVIGNHEFDRGAENVVRQFQRWSNFNLLAANYKFEQGAQDFPNFGRVGTVTRPFVVLNAGGLKVAAIGMANLSSMTSVFDQPNKTGLSAINTVDVAQTYVDLLRPYVDLVVMVTHLGLDVDQRMVRNTTGIDIVLGGHNHVVINPPQEIRDCSSDPNQPGFVWTVDPNAVITPGGTPPDGPDRDPKFHPYAIKRSCKPRKVLITHSGAFAKYVGRLDLVVTNKPDLASPTGNASDYDPINGFEVESSRYRPIPIDARVPEDPVVVEMLQPYRRALDYASDLDVLVGYSPEGARRTSSTGGDSPLGNLVGNAIWLRLGIQTDFAMTNSQGIRADLNPGPVTVEQMYNIFPFDNTISKMQLSGLEVQELFDFAARRTANRGCTTQIQIAGARIRVNCSGCDRLNFPCKSDDECTRQKPARDKCDMTTNTCIATCENDEQCRERGGGTCDLARRVCVVSACAEQIYIGNRRDPETGALVTCNVDADCKAGDDKSPAPPGICSKPDGRQTGICLSQISPTNLYDLATSNYLATGGSGFRVLQRNTTQVDTKIQQRDALIDYLRMGKPCGWDPKTNNTSDGLKACSVDGDCGDPQKVCACPGHTAESGTPLTCESKADHRCESGAGRCVLAACRTDVARFHEKACNGLASPEARAACLTPIRACELAGEECKILSCIDKNVGAITDNRVELLGK